MNLLDRYVPRCDFADYDDFFSNYRINIPPNFNFATDIVDEYARLEPSKLAMVWCNDTGEEKFIDFGEVSRQSRRIANMLWARGIRRGDHVMLMLMSRYEYWYTVVALHRIGAVVIPATGQLTAKDIEYRCNFADIRALIAINTPSIIKHITAAKPFCHTLREVIIVNAPQGFDDFHALCQPFDDQLTFQSTNLSTDPMIAYFTSGTVGMPKMVAHDYTYPLAHIITSHFWLHNVDGTLHFTAADTGWGKASWGKIYGQWIAGTAVFAYDYYSRYSPLDLLPLLVKYRVNSLCAPPTMYRFLMKEDLTKYDLSAIKHYCTAGEPLNPAVYEQIMGFTTMPIFEGYGQTETVLSVATMPFMPPKPGAMGRPTPLYDIELLDPDSRPVPNGVEGEICIKPRPNQIGLFCGYHRDEQLTRSVWHDGYYHTGDIAFADEDGYLWFVGRTDDIIKSSGYRIGPFEVESALMEHPSVLECAVTPVPDEVRGQVIKATIVLARNYFPSEELVAELQDFVKQTTAPYKYPRIVEFVDHLPKTISGKIRRVEIRGDN